jgi:hypothetical protein
MRRTWLTAGGAVVAAVLSTALVLGGMLAGAGPAGALSGASGPLIFETPDHGSTIHAGNANARFAVAVPARAACPEDSTKGTVVRSFLVFPGTDPATVVYHNYYPDHGYWLADASGTLMLPVITGLGTGLIPEFDQVFVWQGLITGNIPMHGGGGLFDPTSPQPGVWDAGVACIVLGRVQRYWSTRVAFVETGSSFTWHVLGANGGSSSGGSSHAVVIAVVVGAIIAVGIGTIVLLRRRRVDQRPPPRNPAAGTGRRPMRPKVPSG